VTEPNGRECLSCGAALTGRQLKHCTDAECSERRRRAAHLLKVYNLTPEQFDQIVEHQGGLCPITKRPLFPDSGTQLIHVDHDHSTGIVRGVVTAYANTRLIGRLRDWRTAQNLADYLRDPPATKALGAPVVAPGRPKKKRKKSGGSRRTKRS
jgi:hypothetical protein